MRTTYPGDGDVLDGRHFGASATVEQLLAGVRRKIRSRNEDFGLLASLPLFPSYTARYAGTRGRKGEGGREGWVCQRWGK